MITCKLYKWVVDFVAMWLQIYVHQASVNYELLVAYIIISLLAYSIQDSIHKLEQITTNFT